MCRIKGFIKGDQIMRKKCIGIIFLFSFIIIQCGPRFIAPVTPTNHKIEVILNVDPNIDLTIQDVYSKKRVEFAKWIKTDLEKKFHESGYQTISDHDEAVDKDHQYKLNIIITALQSQTVNVTNVAMTGIPRGRPAHLKLKYIFTDASDSELLTDEIKVRSIKGEEKCASTLDNIIFQEVHKKFVSIYKN